MSLLLSVVTERNRCILFLFYTSTMEGGPSIQEAESDTTNSEVLREENGNTWAYSLTNPNGRMHRFIALFFMCFLGFGESFRLGRSLTWR